MVCTFEFVVHLYGATLTVSPNQIVAIRARGGKKEVPVCCKKCIPWCGEIEGEALADSAKHPSFLPSIKGAAQYRSEECFVEGVP